jgi:hypothetical protein
VVFTREGVEAVLALWDDPELRRLVSGTQICASEEVILPTLVALAGHRVAQSPFGYDVVGFRNRYRVADLTAAVRHENVFWVHPVPRVYDHPLREWIRERHGRYATAPPARGRTRRRARQLRSAPLVSCVLPAGDRPGDVAHAIGYFLRQDYADRELIVVDDGADPVADLVPDHPSVAYVRLGARRSTAAKRDVGCAHARGDVIAHWDDDAWTAPWRLRYQVETLVADDAELCGLRTMLFCDVRGWQGWRYEYPAGRRRWLAESTLCYRREVWERGPIPAAPVGGDAGFGWAARSSRAVALADPSFHVAMVHRGDGAATQPAGRWWQPYPLTGITSLLGPDWSLYADAGAGDAEEGCDVSR